MAKNEVDILNLHEQTLLGFDHEESNIDKYRMRLENLKNLVANPDLLHSTLSMIIAAKEKLQEKINDVETGRTRNFYLMETAELIANYQEILRKPKKV